VKISDLFVGVKEISVTGPKIIHQFKFCGITINFTETIVIGWIIIAALAIFLKFLTHNMQKVPTKRRQIIAEWIVKTVNDLVEDTMGSKFKYFAPYISTIFAFSIFGSLISMLGLRPMTGDYNVTLTWALMTFILIQGTKIKTNGIGGYFKSFLDPFFVMLPMNVVSEVSTPVSMSFRHFGNIAGGMIISSLLYFALTGVSTAIGLSFPVFAIGIPAALSAYFDLFSGFMQAFIFIMLTMIYISTAADTD
jgi:F-type H+-transporting ATPase subunit a